MKIRHFFTIVLFIQIISFDLFSQPLNIELWKGVIPGSKSNDGYTENTVRRDGRIISCERVVTPELTICLPPSDKASGVAVLVCPGGGYGMLAFDHEGNDIANWLNANGIAAAILKYRLPSDLIMENKSTGPLQDAQEAIRVIRRNSALWKINPHKVGVIGFSAGGHLASTLSTHYSEEIYPAKDDTDARPDFSVLVYPVISFHDSITHLGSRKNLLGPDPGIHQIRHFSNDMQITKDTPPAFLVYSSDDMVVFVMNSISYYNGLQKKNVPAEIHIFQKGGHGYGLSHNGSTESSWPDLCIKWLSAIGVL